MATSDVLSVGDVAAALGVTRATVGNWIRDGLVRSIKLPGGHYRISREELNRILSTEGPTGDAEPQPAESVA